MALAAPINLAIDNGQGVEPLAEPAVHLGRKLNFTGPKTNTTLAALLQIAANDTSAWPPTGSHTFCNPVPTSFC
eukprot:4382789-Lingulodinium_polyedra.AAC.1